MKHHDTLKTFKDTHFSRKEYQKCSFFFNISGNCKNTICQSDIGKFHRKISRGRKNLKHSQTVLSGNILRLKIELDT